MTYLLFSSGERLSYSWQEPVQGVLSPLPRIKIFSCPMLTRRLRWGKDFTKHFWFIFCFKHLLCDSLRGAPSCSVPDAIKKVAFDSDLCFFSTNIACTLCLGRERDHLMFLCGLSTSCTSNSRLWELRLVTKFQPWWEWRGKVHTQF